MSRALVSVRIIASSLNKDLDSPQAERGLQPLLGRPLPFALPAAPSGCSSESFPHLRRAQGSPPYPLPRLRTLDRNGNSPEPQGLALEGGVRGSVGGGAKSQKKKARLQLL